jgi:hypothetical protein
MDFKLARHALKAGKWLYREEWRQGEAGLRALAREQGRIDPDGFPTLYLVGFTADGFILADDLPNTDVCETREHRPSMAEMLDDLLADDWVVCEPILG